MSAPSRLKNILGHLLPSSRDGGEKGESSPSPEPDFVHDHHIHQLSPTFFLERAAAIEPDAEAIYHVTTNDRILRRSYQEFADRARGLAYYLVKHGFKRVGILAPNTPAFLESIYGIAAAGGVHVAANYRLKTDDIAYIFDFAEVELIVVDEEYLPLLDSYKAKHPDVPLIIDTVSPLSFSFLLLLCRKPEHGRVRIARLTRPPGHRRHRRRAQRALRRRRPRGPAARRRPGP